eukprot:5164926-Prymnesium_polylepis.1
MPPDCQRSRAAQISHIAARCSIEGGWRWSGTVVGAQERAWLTRRPLSLVHSTSRQPDRHFPPRVSEAKKSLVSDP